MKRLVTFTIFIAFLIINCNDNLPQTKESEKRNCKEMLNEFKLVELTCDSAILEESEKKLIPIFNEITELIDELYWYQSYGKYSDWAGVKDSCLLRLLAINFGPWNRFRDNEPIFDSIKEKPAGSNFYPIDMTKEEFFTFEDSSKTSPYTYIRRNNSGKLVSVPYSVENKEILKKISLLFQKAASFSKDDLFKEYLLYRASAFMTDEYIQSDLAWLKTKNTRLDFIAGPIEIYDDKLFGYKTEFESFLLVKDTLLTKQYARFALMLPFLQKALPVPVEYRHEDPDLISNLSICNIMKYGGGSKAGGYTMSVTYPSGLNETGHKNQQNIQFKNVIDAKYEHIFLPIAKHVVDKNQLQVINPEAFLQNNIFFELGLRLGIRNVLKTDKPVREALKENTTILQIVKAYSLSLFIAEKLSSVSEISNLNSNYTCFLVDIFRIARFESSSSYAKAKLILFNYLKKNKAIERNGQSLYLVNYQKIKTSIDELIRQIIIIQGDGNYKASSDFLNEYLYVDKSLREDLDKLAENQLYKDILLK